MGPSNLYSFYPGTTASTAICAGQCAGFGTDVMSLTVPAGIYLISAKQVLMGGSPASATVCYLRSGSTVIDVTVGNVPAAGPANHHIPSSLQSPVEVGAPTTFTVSCANNGSSGWNASVQNFLMGAVQAGSLH